MVLKCQLVTDKTSNYEQNEAKVLMDGICDKKMDFSRWRFLLFTY